MIIISPYSQYLPNGVRNPKTYPYWQEVIDALVSNGKTIVQVGTMYETAFSRVEFMKGRPLRELIQLVHTCETWASVDNFFQHMCSHTNKRGVVVWSRSDPLIFGYQENTNLLKSRSYLRPDQFGKWTACAYLEDAFVDPSTVSSAIMSRCT